MGLGKKSKSEFDPRAFLAKADGGVTVSNYSKGQVVFTQGEPADSVGHVDLPAPEEPIVSVMVCPQRGQFQPAMSHSSARPDWRRHLLRARSGGYRTLAALNRSTLKARKKTMAGM
jgi:hypothetical protein